MKRWYFAALLLGAGVFTGWILNSSRGRPVSAGVPQPKLQPRMVLARGRLEPKGGVLTLGAPAHLGISTVAALHVREGQEVQPGDVIAYLDSFRSLEAAAQQAAEQAEIARTRVALVRQGMKPEEIEAQTALVHQSEAELGQAEIDLKRAETMFAEKLISKMDLETRRLASSVKKHRLDEAQRRLDAMRSVRPIEIEVAENTLRESQANLARSQREMETGVVRSPVQGRVLKILAPVGAQIGGAGLVELGDTRQMYAVAEIYESDRPMVHSGQHAEVLCNGIAEPISGVVERIALQVSRQDPLRTDSLAVREARVVEAWIRLDRSDLVADSTYLQAEVRIIP